MVEMKLIKDVTASLSKQGKQLDNKVISINVLID